jgi:predicted nucleic acid-binding protein
MYPAVGWTSTSGLGGLAVGMQLFKTAARLNARDALHAATALNRGIPTIISPDPAFDDVTGLQRLDPIKAVAAL